MRCLLGFVLTLAWVASPLSVSAEALETADLVSGQEFALLLIPDHLQQRFPGHSRAESELRLEYKTQENRLEEAEIRVKRTRRGLISMAAITAVGGAVMGAAAAIFNRNPDDPWAAFGAATVGSTFALLGGVGMVVTGGMLGARKRDLRELRQAHQATRRRAQRDLARLRLAF